MAKTQEKDPGSFIVPLDINGLNGRMLRMSAPVGKTREILFVYGHHASLERCFGIAEDLNQYGAVTIPDLPGFGGMDSLYKIGQKPTLDNLADYLATFVKLRYRRKHVTIIGFSFGFVIATRMLQRYPDLVKKVDLLVSAVGFASHDDFNFTPARRRFYHFGAKFFSHRVPAMLFRNLALSPPVLRTVYAHTKNAREKFAGLSKQRHREIMDFEIHLWHCNDIRTYMFTTDIFFTFDNCGVPVKLPVWHVAVDDDRYFDNHRVEQHMGVIFDDVHVVKSRMNGHAPSIMLTKEEARPFIPPRIRQLLSER
jgi:pimeloyl-ACP methyl ester carboxylesterase